MQSYSRLLIIALLSILSGWFLFHHTQEASKQEKPAIANSIITNPLFNASFPDITGKQQALKQWQGKVIVLNFWATWCPPCREEMPELSALQQKHKDIVIIGLSTDDLDKTKEFIHSAPVSYPILAGDMDAMTLAETLGDNQSILPYTVIIDSKGAIVKTFFGRINQQILEETLTPLLGVLPTK
jgi:thiol-disulfide isomerase/thioredoxin